MVHTRGMPTLRTILFVTLLAITVGGRASASPASEARAFHEKAKSAFALEKYAQAADYFERAFELKADPAILYNAALSHRLAGNKARALALYQNYLRVFGHVGKWTEVEARVEELKTALAEEQALAPPRPASAADSTGAPANGDSGRAEASTEPPRQVGAASVAPLPTSAPADPPVLVATPSDTGSGEPATATRGTWFWVGVGGAIAVAAGAIALGIVLSQPKDPTASWGHYTAGQ
jgi:hypothetical protein